MKLEIFKTYTPRMIGTNDIRQSSVLIPLMDTADGLHVLFEVRSARLRHQPGDICFPGGRKEDDESAEETAVREACEELLITSDQVELLGPSDYYCDRGRSIYPFVGKLHDYRFTYSQNEVSDVFTVPLSFFLETPSRQYEIHSELQFPEDFPFDKIQGGRAYPWHGWSEDILFWEYEGRVIWGLTARLLCGFIELLKSFPSA